MARDLEKDDMITELKSGRNINVNPHMNNNVNNIKNNNPNVNQSDLNNAISKLNKAKQIVVQVKSQAAK